MPSICKGFESSRISRRATPNNPSSLLLVEEAGKKTGGMAGVGWATALQNNEEYRGEPSSKVKQEKINDTGLL